MAEPVVSQPTPIESPTVAPPASAPVPATISGKARFQQIAKKVTTRHGWLGDYDFAWLCTPALPYGGASRRKLPPFYALDADIPLLFAIVCGFQHSLAMLAGLITPPIIFSGCVFFSAPMDKRRTTMHGRALQLDSSTSSYLISASLITSGVYSTLQICHKPDLETVGILSAFQMSRIHLWGRYYWGTGLITVSPAFLSCAFKLLIQFLPGRWNIFRYLVHCIRGRFRLVTVLAPRNRQGT